MNIVRIGRTGLYQMSSTFVWDDANTEWNNSTIKNIDDKKNWYMLEGCWMIGDTIKRHEPQNISIFLERLA